MIQCSDILAPTDEELMVLVYDEGDLPSEEKDHFALCSACQQRLAAYTTLNHTLQTRLYRRLCPSGVSLSYYCLGMVSEEERVNIASHLLDCQGCATEVVGIRHEQAAFDAFPKSSFSLFPALPRLFATRVLKPANLVTRNAKESTGWPCQYQTGLLNLSLHLSRQTSGEIMLLGILTSTDPTETVDAFDGISIEMYTAPGPFGTEKPEFAEPFLATQVDDVGNLLLAPVPVGEYVLVIQLPDKEVVIDNLKIEN